MAWFDIKLAKTQRSTYTSGKFGPSQDYLTNVPVGVPDSVDPERKGELIRGLNIETPHELYEIFVDGLYDIQAQDRIIIDNRDYVIRAVAQWEKVGSLNGYMRLIAEDQVTK